MSFLAPFFLWLLPLAAIPLIIHMLNRRNLITINFSTIRFLKLLENEVIAELYKEGVTSKQKKYLERLSDIVSEMIMEYDLSYFNINGEFPDGWWNDI